MTARLFTVGVSTLDRPASLARCLDALAAGERQPDEIIVVDQGGNPETRSAVDKRRRVSRIQYIRQRCRGLSAARNTVLRAARGSVVAVTDDDCVPDRRWLSAIATAFERSPAPDAVSGPVLALGRAAPGTFAVSLRTNSESRDFVGDTLPWLVATGANFAMRRERLLQLGGYDERLGVGTAGLAAEDLDVAVRLLRAGGRIRYEPAAIVLHERQTAARRLETRWSYAHGIGALCGMSCRHGDRFGVVMLVASLQSIARRLLRALAARDAFAARQAGLSLAGTLYGLRYGWRIAHRNPPGCDRKANDGCVVPI